MAAPSAYTHTCELCWLWLWLWLLCFALEVLVFGFGDGYFINTLLTLLFKCQWFSGKIQRCHRWAPSSILGWRSCFAFLLPNSIISLQIRLLPCLLLAYDDDILFRLFRKDDAMLHQMLFLIHISGQ